MSYSLCNSSRLQTHHLSLYFSSMPNGWRCPIVRDGSSPALCYFHTPSSWARGRCCLIDVERDPCARVRQRGTSGHVAQIASDHKGFFAKSVRNPAYGGIYTIGALTPDNLAYIPWLSFLTQVLRLRLVGISLPQCVLDGKVPFSRATFRLRLHHGCSI